MRRNRDLLTVLSLVGFVGGCGRPGFMGTVAGRWTLHVAPTARLRVVSARRTMDITQRTKALPELDHDLRFIPLCVEEPRCLASEQIRRYNDRGHLFPINIFSPAEIAETRAYIDDLLPRTLAAGWGNYQVVN